MPWSYPGSGGDSMAIKVKNKTEKPFSLQTTKRTSRTGGPGIYSGIFQNIPKCSKMFQNVPKCSRIFQNIPEKLEKVEKAATTMTMTMTITRFRDDFSSSKNF